MKQPVTLSVTREHGNSGDVITTITDADGDVASFPVAGDCSSYHALATARGWLEAHFNNASLMPREMAEALAEVDDVARHLLLELNSLKKAPSEAVAAQMEKLSDALAAVPGVPKGVLGLDKPTPAAEPEVQS